MVASKTSEAAEAFDVDYDFVAHLNHACQDGTGIDASALQHALQAQGADWYELVQQRCPHLFAAVPVFISARQWQQMRAIIAAAERVLASPVAEGPRGVFYGYDFHLDASGAHLIEINSNAGGGFLNALLSRSQSSANLYGESVNLPEPEAVFLAMFRKEWQRARGTAPLTTLAIVDEQPERQYLYPEFLLAQQWFERADIRTLIVAPAGLERKTDALYCGDCRIDLIYNRLTDFSLRTYPHLRAAWQAGQVVLTPDPQHHARYADKRRLVLLSDASALQQHGVAPEDIATLLRGVPETRRVQGSDGERWWAERKAWFFKPVSGYGSKGAYRGDKMTRRVFEEILAAGDYVAQRLVVPDERQICLPGGLPQRLKFDVRCYVHDGVIQLVAARLYQGQTTNFRTPGGGFALVRLVR